MNHGTDDDEVAGSERPERLVNFQRKMDKLQGRFGEALKRLSKPPSGAPVTSSTHTSEVQREGQPLRQGGKVTRLRDRNHDDSDEEIEARVMAQLARRRGLRAGAAFSGRQQGGRAEGDGDSMGGKGSPKRSSRRPDPSPAAPGGRGARGPVRDMGGRGAHTQQPAHASSDDQSRQEEAIDGMGGRVSPEPPSSRLLSSSAAPGGRGARGPVRDVGGRGAHTQQPAHASSDDQSPQEEAIDGMGGRVSPEPSSSRPNASLAALGGREGRGPVRETVGRARNQQPAHASTNDQSRQEEASVDRGHPKGSPSPPAPTPSSPGLMRSPARRSKSPSRSLSPRRAPEVLQDLVCQLQSLASLQPPPYAAMDECTWLRWWEGAAADLLDVESACVFLIQGDRLWRGAEEEGEAGAVANASAGPVGRAALEATLINTSRSTSSTGGSARAQEDCSAMLCVPLVSGGQGEGQAWGVLQCLRGQPPVYGNGRGRLASPPAFEPRDEVLAQLLAQRLGGAMGEAREAKQRRQQARDEALQRLGRRLQNACVARAMHEWRVVAVQERSVRSKGEEEARRAEEGTCSLGEAMGRVMMALGHGRCRGPEAMQTLMRTAGKEGQEVMGVRWAALLVKGEDARLRAVDGGVVAWGGERDSEGAVRVQRETLLDAAKGPGRGLVWLKAGDGEDMGALVWEGAADEPTAGMMAKAMAPMLASLITLALEDVRREADMEGTRRDAKLAADKLEAQAQCMAEQEATIDDLTHRLEMLQSRADGAVGGTVELGPPLSTQQSPRRSTEATPHRSQQRTPERLRREGAKATSPQAMGSPQQQAHDFDLLLLRHAEGLWRQAGQGRAAVAQHFEIAVTTLPLPRSSRVVRCTILLKDGPGAALRSVSGRGEEVVALHGTAAGQAVTTASVVREGNAMLYVPIGNGATGGVVRLVLQSGGGGEEGLVEVVQVLGGLALAVLHQSATLQAAMQGLSEAATAVSALQARADHAGSEAARHVAASSRAMGVLEAMEGLHGRGRAGLSGLFEAAEQAARAVVGEASGAALLLLVEEEGDGEEGQGRGKGREMWTLWPVRGTAYTQEPSEQRQRARMRIGEGDCGTELRALASGRPLALSSSSTQGEAWLRRSWTYQHAAKGGSGGYGEASLGPATLLIVPVPGAGGRGVAGVLAVVKAGEEEAEDEEEVEVMGLLAAQVGSLLSLQHADLALAKLRSEQAHLHATLAGQRGEDERLRRLLVLARCMLDMMGREGHGASAGCRAVEEGLRQYVLHAAAGRQDHQAPRISVRLEEDAPALALAASGGTEGPPPPVKIEQRPHMHRHARRQEESEDEEEEEEEEEERDGGEQVVVTIGGRPVATVAVQWAVEDVGDEEWLLTRVQEAVGLAIRGLASLERVRAQSEADQSRPMQQLSSALATLLSTDPSPTRPPRLRVVNGAVWELWDLRKLAAWGRAVEQGSRQCVGGAAATVVWLSGEGTGEHVQMFTMAGGQGGKAMVGSGRRSGVDVETYVAKWGPWLLAAEGGTQAGRVKDLLRDVRRLGEGEEKARAKSVLSVPILAHLPLSEDDVGLQIVAVVVLEREGQEGFGVEEVQRAALWSRLLTLQVQAMAATEHRHAQQKQDVVRRLLGKWERWQTGHALRQWRAARRAQAKREAAGERALAKTLKHSHVQAVQSLCACIDVLLCLGGVLEDDDPSLLFTELEAQVAHKLAPALGATHCTLTLVRRGAVKDRPSGLRLPTKAERPTKPPAEGELVLSRPLLNADNELLGVLEVRVESSLGGGALRELEELVGMLALYLGALVTLLLELAGPDGETSHATRYSKALDAPAAPTAQRAPSAGPLGDLPPKCDLLHALLLASLSSASASASTGPSADVSLCRLVSLHVPRLLDVPSAALFLPTAPDASGLERLHCPSQAKGHGIGHGEEDERIRQCYHSRKRVTYNPRRRSSLASPTRLAHPPPDSPMRHQQAPVLQDSQEQADREEPRVVVKPSGGASEGVGTKVVFEPVVDRERGVVRGVLRIELPVGEAETDRGDRLQWVVGLLAEVLEGKGRGEQAGGEERLQAWMGRRYKAWATMLASGMLERPRRGGEAALEALLPRWSEALGDVFGAAHVRVYVGTYRPGPSSTTLPDSLSLWTTARGAKREVKVDPRPSHSTTSLLGAALQAAVVEEGPSGTVLEPWAVGPQALQADESDPEVASLPMGEGDVFGQMLVLARGEEGGLRGRVAVCVVRVVWAAGAGGATDRAGALRALAAQVGARLAEAVWAMRQSRTDAWNVRYDERGGVTQGGVGVAGCTSRSLLTPGPVSPSRDWSRREDAEEGSPMLMLVRDVVPALLQVPLLEPSIEALMRATSLRVEALLLALRRSAHDGPTHSLASVDLLALDQEGLWTVDMQPRVATQPGEPGATGYVTVPGGGLQQGLAGGIVGQVMASASAATGAVVLPNAEVHPSFSPLHDLAGVQPWPTVRAEDGSLPRVALVYVPIFTFAAGEAKPQGDDASGQLSGDASSLVVGPPPGSPRPPSDRARRGMKLRGVLRYCLLYQASDPEGHVIAPSEQQALEALGRVLTGAITILDAAVASKSLNEIYERTEKALGLAQSNLENSKQRAQRLHGLTACAVLAALPLFYEPTRQPSSSSSATLGALLLASRGGGAAAGRGAVWVEGGQTHRVAKAALSATLVLLNASTALLYLLHPRSGGEADGMHVFTHSVRGEAGEAEGEEGPRSTGQWGHSTRARPTGHGRQAGLLGRCLKKAQLLNVDRPRKEDRYNPEVDGVGGEGGLGEAAGHSPTLWVPLKWGGHKTPMGVLRVVRTGEDEAGDASPPSPGGVGFTKDEEIMAEILASHVALALSYAMGIDQPATSTHGSGGSSFRHRPSSLLSAPLGGDYDRREVASTSLLLRLNGSAEGGGLRPRDGPLQDRSNLTDRVETNLEEIKRQLHEIQQQSARSTPVKPRPQPPLGGAREPRPAPTTPALAALVSATQDSRATPNTSLLSMLDVGGPSFASLLSDMSVGAPKAVEAAGGEAKAPTTAAAEKLTALRTENSLLSEALQSFLQNPVRVEGERRASRPEVAAAKEEDEAQGGGFKGGGDRDDDQKGRQQWFSHNQE